MPNEEENCKEKESKWNEKTNSNKQIAQCIEHHSFDIQYTVQSQNRLLRKMSPINF